MQWLPSIVSHPFQTVYHLQPKPATICDTLWLYMAIIFAEYSFHRYLSNVPPAPWSTIVLEFCMLLQITRSLDHMYHALFLTANLLFLLFRGADWTLSLETILCSCRLLSSDVQKRGGTCGRSYVWRGVSTFIMGVLYQAKGIVRLEIRKEMYDIF